MNRKMQFPAGAAVLAAALLVASWLGIRIGLRGPEPRPRVAARGVSLIRDDGARIDLVVFAARGEEVADLRAPPEATMRPIAPSGPVKWSSRASINTSNRSEGTIRSK